MIWMYLKAFLVGGVICAIGQILIDKTRLTPARIVVIYVCTGALLTLLGLYEPLVKFAGAGATVPLSGFGYALAKGAKEAVASDGFLGIFTGGLAATAGGVAAAIFFGYIMSILGKPKIKK
jgi:stage V sporulation protein AE